MSVFPLMGSLETPVPPAIFSRWGPAQPGSELIMGDAPERAPIAPDLGISLAGVSASEDQAAVALARRYAALLDEPAAKTSYAAALRTLHKAVVYFAETWSNPRDVEAVETAFTTIQVALGEHSVASDLGPKLLAVLTQLGLTPTARKETKGGQPSTDPLGEFRQEEARLRLLPGGQH